MLLSCAGRRSYLVRYFQEALAGRGHVIVTNSVRDTPAMLVADDAVVMPPIEDPIYPELVLDLCAAREIGLLCSLFDLDLVALAPYRDRFEAAGTRAALSSPEVVDTCFDKWKTHLFGRALGFDGPRSYVTVEAALEDVSSGDLTFPLIVKPRWGTGSIAIDRAYDADDLRAVVAHVRRVVEHTHLASVHRDDADGGVVIQEAPNGVEYGVDLVHDLEGAFACCFVKEKLGMRFGETDAAITVADAEIEEFARRIGERLGHVGLLDIDVIRHRGRLHLLDMNPRFGGHYPFSHLAGADIPAALLAWARGQEPAPAWLRVRLGVEGCKEILPTQIDPPPD